MAPALNWRQVEHAYLGYRDGMNSPAVTVRGHQNVWHHRTGRGEPVGPYPTREAAMTAAEATVEASGEGMRRIGATACKSGYALPTVLTNNPVLDSFLREGFAAEQARQAARLQHKAERASHPRLPADDLFAKLPIKAKRGR